MRVLLSTIGSRGDVQPLVALATELGALGHDARICAPPDFREWVEELGFPFVPLGPALRWTAKANLFQSPPTPDQIQQMMEGTVATQFETILPAAKECDVIVAGNALNLAARSVTEHLGIRYVFAAYCPITIPSSHHAPPKVIAWSPADASADNLALWADDAARWSERWGPALNRHREALGLAPVANVRDHVLTDTPWLAADPTLAPWPDPADGKLFQPGAWLLADDRPLSAELEAFLDAGEPPFYFGFGSIRAPQDLSRTMIESARALGRRVIVSRGWADLSVVDDASDCIAIGDVNQPALFPRVAAVVHHGGAGTTTAATRAGAPQVVIPQHHDQHYFAKRVDDLGIGSAHSSGAPTTETLTAALEHALRKEVAVRARDIATKVRTNGARVAASELVNGMGG